MDKGDITVQYSPSYGGWIAYYKGKPVKNTANKVIPYDSPEKALFAAKQLPKKRRY